MEHEQAAIAAVETPNTIESLLAQLRALGIARGDTLIVHSSMSKLGWVCGREQAVVMALMRAVGRRGTLVMPAHTSDNSDPADWQCPPVPEAWQQTIRDSWPAFDKRGTPTRGMGRIPECFRHFRGVYRSPHPQVSWCAWGRGAWRLVHKHPLTPMLGMASPLGKLYRRNAKVLLLGVGYDHCTCMHLAETLQPNPPMEKNGTHLLAHGRSQWVTFTDVEPDSDRFPAIGVAYEAAGGAVIAGRVGAAESKVLRVQPLVDFADAWLREHPPENA